MSRDLVPGSEASPSDLLARMLDGYLITQLLHVAARLDLASHLEAGPLTTEELAQATRTHAPTLDRVLRSLASEQLLTLGADHRFELSPLGRHFSAMQGSALARGDLYYRAAGHLLQAVTDGGVPFEHCYQRDFFDHLDHHADQNTAFVASMAARSEREAQAVVRSYDLSGFRHVIDVGGGQGALLAHLLAHHPHLRGTLIDRASVLPAATARLASAGVADRAHSKAGDFFDRLPTDGDLYVLSRVLHDWTDHDAARVLTSCRTAMPADATLLVIDAVLPNDPADNPAAIRMDLHMLILFGAHERTEAQLRELLTQQGFTAGRLVQADPSTGLAILDAVPAAIP